MPVITQSSSSLAGSVGGVVDLTEFLGDMGGVEALVGALGGVGGVASPSDRSASMIALLGSSSSLTKSCMFSEILYCHPTPSCALRAGTVSCPSVVWYLSFHGLSFWSKKRPRVFLNSFAG